MNRHTTRVLQIITTVAAIIFFGGFFADDYLEPILKIFGIKTSGFAGFILVPVGCLGVLVVGVLTLVVSYRQDSHRQEDLKKLAQQNNWSFLKTMSLPFLKELDAYLNDSWLANSNALTGSSNNVLTGKMNGRNIVVSDQIYTTGSHKHRTTHKKTLIGLELPEAQLPVMCLYPEGFMDKVFDGLTRYDIDFDHRPVFSKKYVLYGKNESQIRSFFNDKILDFYEQKGGLTTVCGGKYLVIYDDGLLEPAQILARLNFVFTLANLFLRK